ncbi:LysR family transcriptional regulator [Neisseria sp. Ec49-e6-T10]|uniref:LysR family transcriptional regulator n=1 Tax=Neisseria sp. Ec49-e6-T10 TaxID=3140744 RepID=UPI003EBA86F6
MEIKALRYFIEVVKQNSFTRSAEQLFVTQSTVSKMIKHLEEELGVTLLVRKGKVFTLTDAGKVVFEHGQTVLAAQQQLKIALSDLDKLAYGELSIGLPPMVGSTYFAPILQQYRQKWPNIKLTIIEAGARTLEELARAGKIEVGVTVLPTETSTFKYLKFACSELCLLATADSYWRNKKEVTIEELQNEPFILYHDDFALAKRIILAAKTAGFEPNIAGKSSQWDFIVAMVQAKLGIALLPKILCKKLDQTQFHWCPMNSPVINWELALFWQNTGYLSRSALSFIELTQSLLLPHQD